MTLPDLNGYKRYWYKSKSWDISLPIAYGILFPPNYDLTQKYPLLISIPGSGECGIDNLKQFNWGVGKYIRGNIEDIENKDSLYNKTNCITVVIQPINSHSYSSTMLNDYNKIEPEPYRSSIEYHPDFIYHCHSYFFKTNSFFTLTILDLIKDLLKNNTNEIILYTNSNFSTIDNETILPKVDSNRVYYSGGSWGGAAGLSLLQDGRDIFAAVILYACWGIGLPYYSYSQQPLMTNRLKKEIERIGNIPIMLTCSSYDKMAQSHKDIEMAYLNFGQTEKCISVYDNTYYSSWESAHGSAIAWMYSFSENKYFYPYGKSVYSGVRKDGQVTGLEWLFSKIKGEQEKDPYLPTLNFPMGNYSPDTIYLTENDEWRLLLDKKYFYVTGKKNILRDGTIDYIYVRDKDRIFINGFEVKEGEHFLTPPNRLFYKKTKEKKHLVYTTRNKWCFFGR
jgi:hypothetical protein